MLPALLGTVALAAAPAAGPAPAAAREPAGTLSQLRVAGTPRFRHLRAGDRRVHLRGVNVNALIDYGPAVSPVPLTAADFDQMAALGFNVMRLGVSWSRVLPAPGRLDRTYLAQVTAAVRAAGRRGIYTVISSHSDRYAAGLGTGTEFDGAPAWAVGTGGQPCGDPGHRYYTPCAAAAARRFYGGTVVAGRPLPAWYVSAVAAMAKAGRAGGSGYAGIDLINEPTDPDAQLDAFPTTAWLGRLHRLQRHLVRRLRRDGERAPVWVQPQGPRSTSPSGIAGLPAALPGGGQVVYAPHAYVDTHGTRPTATTPRRLKEQYRRFRAEARSLGAALVIGEFPGAAGGSWDALRRRHIERQSAFAIGGISWVWKQPAAGGYGWHVVEPGGAPRFDTDAALVLSAPRIVTGTRGARVSVRGDRVMLRTRGKAQTLEVWLGTDFSAGMPAGPPRLASAKRARVVSQTHRVVRPGRIAYGGTLVRVRVKSGSASASWTMAG